MCIGRHALDPVAGIPDPQRRLEALQTYTLAAIASPQTREAQGEFPLGDALRMTVSAVCLVRQRMLTADASTFLRAGLDPLFGGLSGFAFLRFGGLPPVDDGDLAAESHVADAELSSDDRELLDGYFMLMQEMAHWKTAFHHRTRIHDCLCGLPAAEQTEFRQLCDSLAATVRQKLKPPLPRGYYRALDAQWDRAVELRTLAALAGKDDPLPAAAGNRRCEIAPGIASLYFVDVLPSNTPCYGFVGFERDRTHWWCSTVWSARVHPLKARLSQIDVTLNDLDRDLESAVDHDSPMLTTILNDRQPRLRRVSHVALHDHTASGLPLPCLFDPDCCYSIAGGNALAATGRVLPRETTVGFWGDFKYGLGQELWTSEPSRTVMHGASAIMSYPTFPKKLPRLPGYPEPLPFASYERWFFEDLSRQANTSVLFHHGAHACRNAFLESAAGEANVLHVSTHGEAQADKPDLSRLFFSGDGGPTYVLLLDILGRDWSRYDLVFLNACLSQAGRKLMGEEALALGWAFLAGGAKSVIACRWPVEDQVAWCFIQYFYRHLLMEEPSSGIRGAFLRALQVVRNVHGFVKPSQWGAFVLLENPAGA